MFDSILSLPQFAEKLKQEGVTADKIKSICDQVAHDFPIICIEKAYTQLPESNQKDLVSDLDPKQPGSIEQFLEKTNNFLIQNPEKFNRKQAIEQAISVIYAKYLTEYGHPNT